MSPNPASDPVDLIPGFTGDMTGIGHHEPATWSCNCAGNGVRDGGGSCGEYEDAAADAGLAHEFRKDGGDVVAGTSA
ncbi:hypothetical protein [Streptomyces sp. BE133]|uniref:hypothetical protein n=1 Tax=Streptomyces sp. BE133 TaxID=3002523 RepID=UPI002E78745E|nr:hypothetical protein [Streptomyces sp. BE133]MEE1805275.1 hypothetical protein [Streptomyces sp. BE133]